MSTIASPLKSAAVHSPPDSRSTQQLTGLVWQSLNWRLFWARVKYWTWSVITKSLLTIVYFAVISQGLRYMLPDLGMKLSKLPGFAFLANFRATYRLDLANLLTVIPLIAVWILWHLILEMFLAPECFEQRFSRWDIDRCKSLIIPMAVTVIVADTCLFFSAFSFASWGGSQFSVAALLASATYVVLLVFVTFVSLYLSQNISELKKED